MLIRESTPKKDTLTHHAFASIDYEDAWTIEDLPDGITRVDTFAEHFFLAQPLWLRVISMQRIRKMYILDAIKTDRFAEGSKIGSWRIFEHNRQEIVFGESLGFMQYRFGMLFEKEKCAAYLSTVVHYQGSMGKFYFALVEPLHRRFVLKTLENTRKRIVQMY